MSEVDDNGNVMSTFTDFHWPRHLSTDMVTGHVLVADSLNHRILQLDSQLALERVLVDTNSPVKPRCPQRLHLNELTSQLYVLHDSSRASSRPDVITQWSLQQSSGLRSRSYHKTGLRPASVCLGLGLVKG